MDRLTKQDIEAVWSDVYRAYEQHTPNIYPEAIARLRAPFDLALQSLGLESERSEALPNVEEIPEYFAKPGITEGLANAHPTLLVRQMANEILRLRALSPARVAEGVTVRHDWQPLADEPETYLCRNCGCWTANLPLYEDEICEAKERRFSERRKAVHENELRK